MTDVTRPLTMHRWCISIALSFLCTGVFAQAPPFVPEPATGREIVDAAVNPGQVIVQTATLDLLVEAVVPANVGVLATSVNVFEQAAGPPSGFLGTLPPAGVSPFGLVFGRDITFDVSTPGTMELIATALARTVEVRATTLRVSR